MNTIGPTFAKDHNGAVCIGYNVTPEKPLALIIEPRIANDVFAYACALYRLSQVLLEWHRQQMAKNPGTANPEPSSDTGA